MKRPVPDEVVLGLLKIQPAHGYELLDYFRSRAKLGRIWTMSTSQLYAVLKRLEREGAIIGCEQEAVNAPARVEYSLTKLGEQNLFTWLYDIQPSASIHRIRILFLSRVYIANLLELPLKQIITAQLRACQIQRDRFIEQKANLGSSIETLTLEFVTSQLEAAVNWLESSTFKLNPLDDDIN
jgi:DNA-binding PadR family transcriptional regulator